MVYLFNYKIIIVSIMVYLLLLGFLKYYAKKSPVFLVFFTLMYIYLNMVIKYTQFPIYNDEFQKSILGPFSIEKNFNFIPLKDGFNFSSLYNIVMVIPFGFLLPLLWKVDFKKIIILGLGFSFTLEAMQAIQGIVIGYSQRSVDVNDLICNTLGAIIGYICFYLFRLAIEKKWGDKGKKDIILSYIIESK